MTVKFIEGRNWSELFKKAVKDTPSVVNKLAEFMSIKQSDPLALFGGNDKQFASGGIYNRKLPKARKAHLTKDLSIVYELSGQNPTVIKLIGILSHSQLGTGQPPNKKKQNQMAKILSD